MFTYRLRGLMQLYLLATIALVVGGFLLLAALTRYLPRFALSPGVDLPLFAIVILVAMAATGRFLGAFRGRLLELNWPESAWLATRQVTAVSLAIFAVMVATKDRNLSRLFIAGYLLLSWLALAWANRRLPRYLAGLAFGRHHRAPTLLVGRTDGLELLGAWMAARRHLGIDPVGFVADHAGAEKNGGLGPWRGDLTALVQALEDSRAEQVVVALPASDREELRRVLAACQAAGSRVLIHDNLAERLPVPMIPIVEDGQFFLTMQDEPLEDPFNRAVKRLFDLAIALPVAALLLPPFALLVWCVQRWQSPGPLCFNRPRGGRARREFSMLKFRTMHHQAPDGEREAAQARRNDPRVYPFGQFLRRTSLDELPQFWNVVRGDMSIVGPRPHLPRHDAEFSQIASLYRTRQLVRPGITGLAQVRGFRGEITDSERLRGRVDLDITYITGWTIWLDLQITLLTLRQVLSPPDDAY